MKFDDGDFRALIHRAGTDGDVTVSAVDLEQVLDILRELSISYDLVMGFVEGLSRQNASDLWAICEMDMPDECRLPMIQHSCASQGAKQLTRAHPPAFGLAR